MGMAAANVPISLGATFFAWRSASAAMRFSGLIKVPQALFQCNIGQDMNDAKGTNYAHLGAVVFNRGLLSTYDAPTTTATSRGGNILVSQLSELGSVKYRVLETTHYVTDFYMCPQQMSNARPYQQVQDMFSLRMATYEIRSAEAWWHEASGAEGVALRGLLAWCLVYEEKLTPSPHVLSPVSADVTAIMSTRRFRTSKYFVLYQLRRQARIWNTPFS